MKTFSPIRHAAAAALLVLLATQATAQSTAIQTTGTKDANLSKEEQALVAKPGFTANDAASLDGMKLRSEQMFRHFTSHFVNASDIAIFPHDGASVVYCMVNGIRNNILYTNKGRLLHTIRYYDASKLPWHVAELMQKEFPDFKMTQVSEITADGETAFLVNIESASRFKTIRVFNDDWSIYQEFDKAR